MKRLTSVLLAVSTLATVSFSGCSFLEEFLGENSSEVAGYEIFDGDFKEVEKSDIQTKVFDNEKYTGATVMQLIQNNLGTEIKKQEKTEQAKGKMEGGKMDENSKSVLANMEHSNSFKVMRESAEMTAAYQMEGKVESKQSAIDEGTTTSLKLYYEDSVGSYVKNDGGAWENYTRIGLEGIAAVISNVGNFDLLEGMIKSQVSEGITVTYFMYEDDEYTKVKVVQSSHEYGYSYEAAAHLIFTKEMKFVAFQSSGKRVEKTNVHEEGVTYVKQNTTEQLLVVSPWSGTITKPTDLPTSAE